jgi:OmpA-OmpF porin, OOP family
VRDISLLLLFLTSFFIQGQADSSILRDARGKTLKKLGRNALKQKDPNSAVVFLEAYDRQKPGDGKVLLLLARSYMEVRDYEKAERAFLTAYNTGKKQAATGLFYHAMMQKSNGKYDSAKINFQTFRKQYRGKEKSLKKLATKEIAFCDSIKSIMGISNRVQVNRLDNSINKVNSEAAPLLIDEKTMLYASLRTDKKEYYSEDDTAGGMVRKLYLAKKDKDRWKFAEEFPYLNEPGYNTGNACLSPDGKRIYFTRCKRNAKDKMICNIYVSEKSGNEWSEPIKLPAPLNSSKYTSTMPALAIDPLKGTDVLYFVSDRKKGRGGYDIWYSAFDKKKDKFKPPKNAGSKINTQRDEITPHFDNENRTLYFSSDGFAGLGGFDIFRATGDGRRWVLVQNLGKPFNTGADDIYFTLTPGKHEGFLVSNRKGGNALKNSTCCDDIYAYRNSAAIKLQLKGTVRDLIDDSEPISQATVDIFIKEKNSDEKVLVSSTLSDSRGNFEFPLEADRDYIIMVKKQDYLGTIDNLSTNNISESRDVNRVLKILKRPKEPIIIPNIRYEFDRANLTSLGMASIDSMLITLMVANPELIIEIQSHTDSKGSEAYNRKLSQRRANEIVKYIIGKGISSKRIKPKGYGEDVPVAPNENPDGSDNPEGRAKNRRTQFKIIGNLDVEIIERQ